MTSLRGSIPPGSSPCLYASIKQPIRSKERRSLSPGRQCIHDREHQKDTILFITCLIYSPFCHHGMPSLAMPGGISIIIGGMETNRSNGTGVGVGRETGGWGIVVPWHLYFATHIHTYILEKERKRMGPSLLPAFALCLLPSLYCLASPACTHCMPALPPPFPSALHAFCLHKTITAITKAGGSDRNRKEEGGENSLLHSDICDI